MAYFTLCMITHRILLWLNSFESFLQRNSDLHWLQCNQSSVYWDSPSHLTWMCAHIHPFLCLHKLIFSWSCGWLQENKQALILLKHDLHQTYVLYFNLYKLRSLSLTVFSCPLPLPSSVFETCDIDKLHWMPSTGQKASLSKRESEG